MTTETRVRDRFIALNGLRFHYREWGRAVAPPFVLLHGVTSHARAGDAFAESIADRSRVLALDQRGHGETEWADSYATDLMVADLRAFAQSLSLTRFALVGHSMGGINAYVYAAKHPETVERLVIGDIGPDVLTSSGGALVAEALRLAAQAAFDNPEQAVQAARALNPRPSDEDLRHRVIYNLVQRDDGRWVWRYDAAHLAGHVVTVSEADQWELLAHISCPTLLVRGAESDILSREVAERMRQVIPDCRVAEVPNSGHTVPLDNPTGFAHAVRPFLLAAGA